MRVPLCSTLADIGAALTALQAEAGLPKDLMPTKAQLEQLGASPLHWQQVLFTASGCGKESYRHTLAELANTTPISYGYAKTCQRSLGWRQLDHAKDNADI